MRELGVWRSWLAHLVWDQRVLCSSHSTPTFNKNLLIFSRFFLFTQRGLRSWITGKSMCLSIYLSKSEQEVFDI